MRADRSTGGVLTRRAACWAAGLCVALMLSSATPLTAQHGRDAPPPAQVTTPSGANPTAQAPTEAQLLQELGKLQGRVTIPDYKASILEQPQGRSYQRFHERILPWLGSILIIGMIAALAAFYLMRGRIMMDERSGVKIERFNAFERFIHWLTAASFLVLAITGLNYIFGKRLLFPLIGPEAFATWSQYAKFAHNAVSLPFVLGMLAMIVLWVRDNLPDRYDAAWLKQMGGFLSHANPPAARFNAGQKLIFWSVILGGLAATVSGVMMLFPFWTLDINGMQIAQYVHAISGMILIAVIIAHIYIGSLGMEGAYDAMGSGQVDLAWAKAHHSVWVEEEQAKTASGRQLGRGAVPAE